MLNSFDYMFEKIDSLETEYIKILCYNLSKNYSENYCSYQYPRLCTIIDGQKQVTLNNQQQFTYSKENYLLLAPNTKVHMKINQNTRAIVFEMSNELICKVLSKIDICEKIKQKITIKENFFLGNNKFDISKDIKLIFDASKSKQKNNIFLIDLYAQKLVFDLIKNKTTYYILQSNNSTPLSIALKYIDKNIHTQIKLKNLAKDLNMSLSNFSHMFKKNMGLSPIDYIKNKKLELAIHYLKEQSVTDVAFELGYDNISYFIKLFKQKYNLTPKQYKLTYFENFKIKS